MIGEGELDSTTRLFSPSTISLDTAAYISPTISGYFVGIPPVERGRSLQ